MIYFLSLLIDRFLALLYACTHLVSLLLSDLFFYCFKWSIDWLLDWLIAWNTIRSIMFILVTETDDFCFSRLEKGLQKSHRCQSRRGEVVELCFHAPRGAVCILWGWKFDCGGRRRNLRLHHEIRLQSRSLLRFDRAKHGDLLLTVWWVDQSRLQFHRPCPCSMINRSIDWLLDWLFSSWLKIVRMSVRLIVWLILGVNFQNKFHIAFRWAYSSARRV